MASRTPEQRARARAQRATRARLQESRRTGARYESAVPKAVRARISRTQAQYAYDVATGAEPEPRPGTPEARQLARMASLAKYNKADPQFLPAFEKYFYHDELHKNLPTDADIEDEADYDSDESE
jgi:hypothetical protein